MSSPLASMTGAATHVNESSIGRFEVELRSVNNRFLKTSVRVHGPAHGLDALVEEALRQRLERGHVSAHVRFTPDASLRASIDPEAFQRAAAELRQQAGAADLPPVRVSDVLRMPDVLGGARPTLDRPQLENALGTTLRGALDGLVAARQREGKALRDECRELLDRIDAERQQIDQLADTVPTDVKARLQDRIERLLVDDKIKPDDAWLARELAVAAEKCDIREELARLEAHVAHGREVLDQGGPCGRRLDFLVQELHRETNTIGSKSADLRITERVMELKTQVERLREQVANVE